tara:strand:- start:6537 stop:7751 length:1215 start_codon:yes stop_codon:yes gene_type:complete
MGIGSSLKKFVKKAAPVVGMVAPFIPGVGPAMGAAIGALGQVAGGGGAKEALLGGLGGYAAGGFGQGIVDAGGWGKVAKGGIGNILSKGWGGVTGTPLGKGIGGIFNKFTGGAPVGTGTQAATKGTGILEQTYGTTGGGASLRSTGRAPVFTGEGAGTLAESGLTNNIVDTYTEGGGGTWGGLVDFAKNAFNEKNLPLTAGLLGGLAQMWENKTGEKPGQVAWGEGEDYYSPTRGSQVHGGVLTTPAAANGGRIGLQQGGMSDLYFGDEGEQSLYRDLVRVFTGEITGVEAQAIMEAAEGDLGGRAIEMAKQEASYKPTERLNTKADGGIIGLANGGEPTHEMDYRGGGFIPVGAYERADDVPARLSKNEFVMTADAVRAAGGGSIEKGSQRMYDLMNGLEAQA